jgi:hypothetical protein
VAVVIRPLLNHCHILKTNLSVVGDSVSDVFKTQANVGGQHNFSHDAFRQVGCVLTLDTSVTLGGGF